MSGGWEGVNFSSPPNLTAGTVYDLVVTPLNVSSNSYAQWEMGSLPANDMYPYDQVVDLALGAAKNTGSGWAFDGTTQPLFVLQYSGTNNYNGNPYAGGMEVTVGGNDPAAQIFEVAASPETIQSVGAYVRENGSPVSNLNWQIVDASAGTTLGSGTLATPSQVAGTYGWVETNITPLVMPTGLYRLVLSSSSFSGFYMWMAANTNGLMSISLDNITYDGAQSRAQTWMGSWGDIGTNDDYDFAFRFLQSPPGTPTPTPTPTPPGTSYLGNRFALNGNFSNFPMDNMKYQGSVRFTARQSNQLQSVNLYWSQGQGPSAQYIVQVEGDNNGTPNGVVFGSPATIYVGMSGGWEGAIFSSPPSLTVGAVYDLVVTPYNVSATAYAQWRMGSLPANDVFPYDQVADKAQGAAKNVGNGWVFDPTVQPLFVLQYAGTNQYDGNPYSSGTEFEVGSSNTAAQIFEVAASPETIQSVGAYVRENGSPAGNLNWQIVDASAGTTLGSGTLATPAQVAGTYGWVETNITPLVLPTGVYRLVLSSSAFPMGDYRWMAANTNGLMSISLDNITYDGFQSRAQTLAGSAWGEIGANYDYDFAFRFLQSAPGTPTPTPTPTPPGTSYLGNRFALNGAFSNFPMDNINYQGSVRFTARQTNALQSVNLYWIQGQAPGEQYIVQVEGDNNGTPNGVVFGSPVTNYVNFGWVSAHFASQPNLTAGMVYDLVVMPYNINANTYAQWRMGSLPSNGMYPYDQVADPAQGAAKNVGNGWVFDPTVQPLFVLQYAGTNNFDGNPYAAVTEIIVNNTIPPAGMPAELFPVNGGSFTIQSVGAYLRENGSPSANLNWQIVDASAGTTMGGGILATPAQVGGTYGWVETNITPLVLPTGTYRFVLSSTPSYPSNYNNYLWMAASTGGLMSISLDNITYDGSLGRAQTWAGTWQEIGTNNDYDFAFRFLQSPQGSLSPTPTQTSTNTPANTPTVNPSWSPTSTPTNTPTVTLSNTPTITLTNSPTLTVTVTSSFTSTPDPSDTPTYTSTVNPSFTTTFTPTVTSSNTPSGTPTVTPTVFSCGPGQILSLNWNTSLSMTNQAEYFSTGVINGIIYTVGGYNGSYLNNVQAFNPSTNSWATMASLPTSRGYLGVGVINNILYAVGGANANSPGLNTLEAFDPSTNTWSELAPMPTGRSGLAVGVVNGILYATGGMSGNNFLNTLEAYNPATNSWSELAAMPTGRGYLGVGVVNGILYAVGGLNAFGSFSPVVEAYNPGTNSWASLASLPTGVDSLAVGVLNGTLYAMGGYNFVGLTGTYFNTVEAYDPTLNAWDAEASMPTGRAGLAVGVVNGTLYALGGINGNGILTVNEAATVVCTGNTFTPTSTATYSSTLTPTNTLTYSPTTTPTVSTTNTPSSTPTATPTVTATVTSSFTSTPDPSDTPSSTSTPTMTVTSTWTPTITSTLTTTNTYTATTT
jgi:N-acetylneuraminic acid mutarotase